MNRWQTTFLALLFGFGSAAFSPSSGFADETFAAWRPASVDELEFERRFAEELLNRGFYKLANAELKRLEPRLETASKTARFRFGAIAIRAVVESSRLSSASDRAEVAKQIDDVRKRVLLEESKYVVGDETSNEKVEFQSALVRAYVELGVLDAESKREITAEKRSETPPETTENSARNAVESAYFTAALELSRRFSATLPSDVARPFVYWNARVLLEEAALENDVKSRSFADKIAGVERDAAALEKTSRARLDEYFFLAKFLQIESERLQGNVAAASAQIGETLDLLENAEAEIASEFNAVLVAEEIRLLTLEGKTSNALRLALGDVDLLNRPLAENTSSRVAALFAASDFRNFANAELFWRVVDLESDAALPEVAADSNADSKQENASPSIEKERLIELANAAVGNVSSNFWKTRAARLVRDAAQRGDDWRTTEAAANDNYRRGLWDATLADFDRASSEAAAVGAEADAFRLAGAAAAIVDKINREKIFETDELSTRDPIFWRSEAARRFDALSRSRPNDPLAPRLFLLALEYSAELPTEAPETRTARRLEYLRRFPTAENFGEFANESARRALDAGRFDDAAAFLDFVPATNPNFSTSLDLERRLAQARLTENAADSSAESDSDKKNALFTAVVRRLLTKTTFASEAFAADSETSVESSIAEAARRLTSENCSETDSKILDALFETAISTDRLKIAPLNAAFEELLTRWEDAVSKPSADEKAKFDSLRFSLWVDAKKTDEILRYVADEERSTPGASTATLERLLKFAEKTSDETKKQLAEFVLEALDSASSQAVASDDERRVLLRAEALRFAGKSQESLNLFAVLRKKNPKNVDAVRGIANLLSERSDEKTLERALRFWSDVADLVPSESTDWWDAKERCVEIYARLGRKEQAAKMTKTIWLTRSDPADPERRARWEKLCR